MSNGTGSTRLINQNSEGSDAATIINMENGEETRRLGTDNSNGPSLQRNFFSLFSEARSQIGRVQQQQQRSVANVQLLGAGSGANTISRVSVVSTDPIEQNTAPATASSPRIHGRQMRSWRMNLNDVFSFSSTAPTQALRSFITHSSNFRYMPLNTNESSTNTGDNIHILLPQGSSAHPEIETRTSRSNSLRGEDAHTNPPAEQNENGGLPPADTTVTVTPSSQSESLYNNRQNERAIQRQNSNSRNTAQQADTDDDSNVISDISIIAVTHFARYLPFIAILLLKFVHDYFPGILGLILLHGVMYQINKSLRKQIAKFSNKNYGILARDFVLVAFVVACRFILATTPPDPFGLLIPASSTHALSDLASSAEQIKGNAQITNNNLVTNFVNQVTPKPQSHEQVPDTITTTVSLGVLLYYIAINDLTLKLITILIKICVTMLPTKVIRHKPRARMYVLIEYSSQFYRSLVPMRQWVMYLFGSYTGLDVITGIFFPVFYLGAKGFELVERGKCLKKAATNFLRNMDYERKATNDEIDAAGPLCPICHDSYTTPVVLECGHIFCDDCVSTWFKREQTCPMCRAKVSEDPTWQDGATTFFYQLC